jgi:hypothetical protein
MSVDTDDLLNKYKILCQELAKEKHEKELILKENNFLKRSNDELKRSQEYEKNEDEILNLKDIIRTNTKKIILIDGFDIIKTKIDIHLKDHQSLRYKNDLDNAIISLKEVIKYQELIIYNIADNPQTM